VEALGKAGVVHPTGGDEDGLDVGNLHPPNVTA
jgi:hypothetical protein